MSATRPNVVLVSIDSLRADHCGFLGDDRGLTPTMDRLAADGVAFRTAVSPGPRTFSTMPTLFTGRHRAARDFDRYDGDEWERRLSAIDAHLRRHAPLPERLRELGYATAGVSPNPWTSRASGFDRGFDRFDDRSGRAGGRLRALADRLPGVGADDRGVKLATNLLSGSSFFSRWDRFYDDLLAVRDRLPEPYFLWVFLLDTHYPFLAARRHRVEASLAETYAAAYRSAGAMRGSADAMPARTADALRRSYRDTVRSVDDFLDTLVGDLAGDDPALFVHSDHGEAFGEHGTYGHHTGHVYEENVHVPYLVHGAGTATVDAPVSLSTLPGAVLSVARGGTVDPAASVADRVVASNDRGDNRTVRGSRYKLVVHGDRTALYDLERDPGERTDVADERPDVAREFVRELAAFDGHRAATGAVDRAATAVAANADL